MTGQDIIDHFQWLVDDENVDETRELVLLNRAYYRLCSKRIWNFLKAVDESQTITASTKTYDCPTDTMVLLQNNWYKDSLGNYSEKNKVSFQSRLKYATSTKYYWYDKKNNKFALTRNPTDSEVGNTLVLDYIAKPAELTTATSPVFDEGFHTLLAYEMMRQYYYNDQGEKNRSWNREAQSEYDEIYKDMINWDNNLDPNQLEADEWVNLN